MAGNQSHDEQLNEELAQRMVGDDQARVVPGEESTQVVPGEELTQRLDDEELVEQQLAHEAEEAIDSLYGDEETPVQQSNTGAATRRIEVDSDPADEDEERLTQLLTPIQRTAHPVMPVVQGPTESVHTTLERNEGRIRHKVAAALISILAIFGIGLGAGMYSSHVKSEQETAAIVAENERKAQEARDAQAQAEAEAEEARVQEAAHRPRALKFIISAADYDSLATRLPLVITGVDLDGNEVQTEGFINNEGDGISLIPGEYTASIPASPICANGGMYKVPDDTYVLSVPNGEEEIIQIDQAIVLIPMNNAEITEDAVNNAYNWAIKDTQLESVAETNATAARKIVSDEKERKAAEERRKQAEEQRAPLAQSFAESFYTNVGFPDPKDDSKVRVITNWNAVVGQYVASGSAAAGKLSSGNGARYSYATEVKATNISGDSVTVAVDVVSGDDVKSGWTRNKSSKTIVCTFDDNNKITDFTVG